MIPGPRPAASTWKGIAAGEERVWFGGGFREVRSECSSAELFGAAVSRDASPMASGDGVLGAERLKLRTAGTKRAADMSDRLPKGFQENDRAMRNAAGEA